MSVIYESLLKLQMDLPKLINDSNNPAWKSKYISLQQLLNIVSVPIHKNGFCIITKSGKDEFNKKYIIMCGEKSELFVPIQVEENVCYKVLLKLKKTWLHILKRSQKLMKVG